MLRLVTWMGSEEASIRAVWLRLQLGVRALDVALGKGVARVARFMRIFWAVVRHPAVSTTRGDPVSTTS
jgi:hypothetical protein